MGLCRPRSIAKPATAPLLQDGSRASGTTPRCPRQTSAQPATPVGSSLPMASRQLTFPTPACWANNCDSCHKGGYASWYPGRLHSNITVTGACETCHVPTTFGLTVKPSTPIHSGVTSGCESCHNTTSWFGAKPNHAAYTAATTCSTCHDGTSAPGKNASHFPTSSIV